MSLANRTSKSWREPAIPRDSLPEPQFPESRTSGTWRFESFISTAFVCQHPLQTWTKNSTELTFDHKRFSPTKTLIFMIVVASSPCTFQFQFCSCMTTILLQLHCTRCYLDILVWLLDLATVCTSFLFPSWGTPSTKPFKNFVRVALLSRKSQKMTIFALYKSPRIFPYRLHIIAGQANVQNMRQGWARFLQVRSKAMRSGGTTWINLQVHQNKSVEEIGMHSFFWLPAASGSMCNKLQVNICWEIGIAKVWLTNVFTMQVKAWQYPVQGKDKCFKEIMQTHQP